VQVFHIDARTRVFRGRSSSGALPPSRQRAFRRSIRASIPANAVINAPPEDAASGHCWVASHIDRSEPTFPRAIWRQVAIDTIPPAPATDRSNPGTAATVPEATVDMVSAEAMAATALALLLTRGKAKTLARREGLVLLGRWVEQQGGSAEGRLGAEVETLLNRGKGIDAKTAEQRRRRRETNAE
jgi:hypothetical protein